RWGMSRARVIVLSVTQQGMSVAAAAARFGVSRQHVYVLLARYRQAGIDAVEPRSWRPNVDISHSDYSINPIETTGPTKPKCPTKGRALCELCRDSSVNDVATQDSVVLSDTDEKKWQTALAAAKSVLSGAIAPRTAPDYEPERLIRQEQKRLKRAEIAALIVDYRGGMSTYQLAAKWQINRHSVSAILNREGVERRSNAVKLTEAELIEAEALYAEGWSMNALAERYGVDPKTMKSRLASS
ncbi:MAG: helix-turn-helix domain-containing protein, partial [Micrococcales bacterium]|nr:helix-turn-helix domain-containing protein [Micrococcales bacterium]